MIGVQCTPILLGEDRVISNALEFIETPLFESQRKEMLTDEEFRALQSDIIKNPEMGSLIVGTGGLRKVRLAGDSKGKSGGYRTIYLLIQPDVVYLVLLYKKGRKDSLTQKEKNLLKEVSRSIKREYDNEQ
ncbi:type II toxin-antitoxin system RelE/ParE family toxin [Vibrio alginolyticus]|uniref:type II toxin-antitoxin system RelE/ParE family toxin n=1 Tax=Vibrio alginolyticus TaxID=663 RepID=UPI001EEA00AD|nr:type II toxin-antitoxin system RelE/ParE family toxin [Vibrio alginolyticus]MCG6307032.1 type II toxin-antitoxin system RelE/ParE family toxin [Vibrio alginolyticus]